MAADDILSHKRVFKRPRNGGRHRGWRSGEYHITMAETMSITSFHEACHAIVAVRLEMANIRIFIRSNASESTLGDIEYEYKLLTGEALDQMHQRRLAVAFAGPVWEVYSDVKRRPRQLHLHQQKSDCKGARKIIREVRKLCGLKRDNLSRWVEEAWNEAMGFVETEMSTIMAIAESLDERKILDDGMIRKIVDLGLGETERTPAGPDEA